MSLSSRNHILLVLPAVAVVFAAACGAAAPPTASPAPSAPPTAAATPYHVNVPAGYRGAWHASVAGSTTVSNGVWSMSISQNEITITNPNAGPDEAFALGVTDITADHVTFWADPECQAGNIHKEGTYTYALVQDQLVFTLIQDQCQDRGALLTAAPWERETF